MTVREAYCSQREREMDSRDRDSSHYCHQSDHLAVALPYWGEISISSTKRCGVLEINIYMYARDPHSLKKGVGHSSFPRWRKHPKARGRSFAAITPQTRGCNLKKYPQPREMNFENGKCKGSEVLNCDRKQLNSHFLTIFVSYDPHSVKKTDFLWLPQEWVWDLTP